MSEKKGSELGNRKYFRSSQFSLNRSIVNNFRDSELDTLCTSVPEFSGENSESDGFTVKGLSTGSKAF